jgi:hypothetical protein
MRDFIILSLSSFTFCLFFGENECAFHRIYGKSLKVAFLLHNQMFAKWLVSDNL